MSIPPSQKDTGSACRESDRQTPGVAAVLEGTPRRSEFHLTVVLGLLLLLARTLRRHDASPWERHEGHVTHASAKWALLPLATIFEGCESALA
jgi:hypothetical protein